MEGVGWEGRQKVGASEVLMTHADAYGVLDEGTDRARGCLGWSWDGIGAGFASAFTWLFTNGHHRGDCMWLQIVLKYLNLMAWISKLC
jgi:hypothetical protein